MDHGTEPKGKRKRTSIWDGTPGEKQIRTGKSTKPRNSAPPKGHGSATPWYDDHPPASTSPNAKNQDGEPGAARPTQPPSPKTYIQDPGDGQWKYKAQNEDYRQQNRELSREMERVVLGPPKHLAAQPGRESAARAAMFTDARINAIHGGIFLNVAQIYECESGGGPAFPIMVLGLQAVSFATRAQYPHCSHPFDAPALLIPEPTSTSSLAIHLPLVYQEIRLAIGPLALWLLIKMWIQRRSFEYR